MALWEDSSLSYLASLKEMSLEPQQKSPSFFFIPFSPSRDDLQKWGSSSLPISSRRVRDLDFRKFSLSDLSPSFLSFPRLPFTGAEEKGNFLGVRKKYIILEGKAQSAQRDQQGGIRETS